MVVGAYTNGVSTRKIKHLAESLGIENISAGEVKCFYSISSTSRKLIFFLSFRFFATFPPEAFCRKSPLVKTEIDFSLDWRRFFASPSSSFHSLAAQEPTEKPNTFFSKDKNQIEKFPLSDFFPDYNLL